MLTAELPKSYSPAEAEAEVRHWWDAAGVFHADPNGAGEPYCILIPPPNVTAPLHLGHALNNTLQDVLIRYHRMRGFNTLWMPGTDHAGIATQTVVEKRLLQQGRSRSDFSREAFLAKVQAWKDEYEATITEQLKALGCSCDWERQRFTMDDICARAVREAFFRLFKAGLIYRGKRLVNWDPATGTALADDEVEMREVEGRMWYMRYPLEERHEGTEARRHEGDIDYVTVATTRPETMLGDTAVAVNPKDPRAAKLVGRSVRLPIVNRVVPIIADDYVVMPGDPDNPMAEYATGFLKVTPAHDPNDWEIGLRHEDAIPYGPINVLAPDATISRDHGWPAEEFETGQAAAADALLGLSREKARDWVVEWFDQNGLLEEVRPYHHAVGHSYRSHVPIEPYLSDQWYVKVTDDRMVGEAQRALNREQFDGKPPKREASPAKTDGDGELTFFPARYAKTYQAWHAGLRDWCISRQLWWGHRMPVWYHESALETQDAPRPNSHTPRPAQLQALPEGVAQREYGSVNYVCIKDPEGEHEDFVKQLEAAGYVRDPDVLDTWFSSGLWPISTMGWPRPQDSPETAGLLEIFNPSTVLVTARDIITLWVSRMVMFNRHLRDGKLPFRHAYINPVLQDGHGQMMSKSLGNGVDPRDIIHSHGADALRFVLCQIATSTQDIRMPVDMVCPHCSHGFHPQEATSPAGYRVAAP
ncbi:MAG: valine--tRNA ligase, partial [Planctomycetota bacterium]